MASVCDDCMKKNICKPQKVYKDRLKDTEEEKE